MGYLMYQTTLLRIAQPQTKVMSYIYNRFIFWTYITAHQAMGSTTGAKLRVIDSHDAIKGKP